MVTPLESSESSGGQGDFPDAFALAALVACHHRGPLSAAELRRLLAWTTADEGPLGPLVDAGLLVRQASRYAVSQKGRDHLDRVLEGIEGELAPDDPAYVRRFRRADPTLPFDTNTIWAEAVCVNFSLDPEALRPLIPQAFDLDLHEGRAFISMTASRLKDFGVGWVPRALRMNFYQATYRAHVIFTDFRGRRTRGCYFVRSETNSPLMSLAANLLPEFKAHHCSTYPIVMARRQGDWILTVDSGADPGGKIVLVLDTSRELAEMPPESIFRTREEAYSYIVDFRDAFSYNPDTNEVYFLQIDRGEWDIRIVEPVDHYLGYFHHGGFTPENARLDSVFYFTDCPYRWLPLVKERRAR